MVTKLTALSSLVLICPAVSMFRKKKRDSSTLLPNKSHRGLPKRNEEVLPKPRSKVAHHEAGGFVFLVDL